MKKKKLSLPELLLILICILLLIITAGVNVLFEKYTAPKIGSKYLYVVEENDPSGIDAKGGTALLAEDARNFRMIPGDIILCYPADDPDRLCLRSIEMVETDENGKKRYLTCDSYHTDNAGLITNEKIVAVATECYRSESLGSFITFIRSLTGKLLGIVLPGIVMMIIFLRKSISARRAGE